MYDPGLNEQKMDFDWALLLCACGLMCMGGAFIYSATAAHQSALAWFRQMYVHQILWYLLGLCAAAALLAVDYSRLARWSGVAYGLTIVLLVAVFVFGSRVHGGKRWITLGIFGLQPSEFAKIAFILLLANFLSRPADELRRPRLFWATLGLTLVPFILILKEPDLGSALVFPAISLAMMYVAGVPARMLAGLVGGVSLLGVLLVAIILFAPARLAIEPYQKARLLTYFGRNKSYNVEQALISVGSGGLTGKGWRHGTQNALGFLPRAGAPNDFIFSDIAEEEGFVGSVVVLALYGVLLFSGIKIASQARDHLGQLLAVGVVTLLFCHVFINVGMNIRLMPVTGIPLPLLSYGGSSVVCSLIAIGILHSIHIYRRSY
ncbi:MAG: rod shape-determining protein RodA [Verrucomicrobiota bacterium]|jgi:rod shape determining protein RodA